MTRVISLFLCHSKWPLPQGSEPDLKLNTRTRRRERWQEPQAVKLSCPNAMLNKEKGKGGSPCHGYSSLGVWRPTSLENSGRAKAFWFPMFPFSRFKMTEMGEKLSQGFPVFDSLQLHRVKLPCPKVIAVFRSRAYTFVSTKFLSKGSGTRLTMLLQAKRVMSSSNPSKINGCWGGGGTSVSERLSRVTVLRCVYKCSRSYCVR